MSRTIEVTIEVEIPGELEATSDEIEEYIAFEIGSRGSMSGTNPILESDFEPEIVSFSEKFRW